MKTFLLLTVQAIAFLLAMSVFAIAFMYPVKVAMNAVFSPEALLIVFGVSYFTLSKALSLSFLTAVLFKGTK